MRPEFQNIVDEVSRLLESPATLEDRDFSLVAFCSHEAQLDEVRLRSILRRQSTPEVQAWFEQFGIATSDEAVRTPASTEHGVLERLCLPARWRGVTYGYLWLVDEHRRIDARRVPAAMDLAERAGALMAQQARAREELEFTLQDLLSGDAEAAERAANEIHELGTISREVPVAAVELRLVGTGPSHSVPMNLWRLPRSTLATTGEDHTTLLVPVGTTGLESVLEVARQAWGLYAERLDPATRANLVAGVGDIRPDLAGARASRREALLAARVAEAVPDLRPVAVWPDLGVYRLLACGPEKDVADAVLDAAVLRLLAHGDPDLQLTATAFLDSGGNVQQTASALNVHRQTVYYRVRRIEEVTGLDLSRGDHRLLLHLGLTLAPVLASPSPAQP
jgi:sugar diacid utilization regulator